MPASLAAEVECNSRVLPLCVKAPFRFEDRLERLDVLPKVDQMALVLAGPRPDAPAPAARIVVIQNLPALVRKLQSER